MTTIKVIGQIDDQHRLTAAVPPTLAPGEFEVLVLVPLKNEDEAGQVWMAGNSREWHAELDDQREDIYSLNDGEPVDEAR